MRQKKLWRRRFITGTMLTFVLVSSVNALSHEDVRGPVVRFIDFYVAAQQADAPPMSIWERVIYGLAIARAKVPPAQPAQDSCH
jgi:hypothetical protein